MKTAQIYYRQVKKSLNRKLIAFFSLLLFTSMLFLAGISYTIASNSLTRKGEIILRNSTVQAMDFIEEMHYNVKHSAVPSSYAQEKIKETLLGELQEDGTRKMHGNIDLGKNGYFIIYDSEGTEIMHPTLEGENHWDTVDYSHYPQYVVRQQIAIAKESEEGGIYRYTWRYPDSQRVGEKISYAMYMEEWDWIVCATAYRSDFDSAANTILTIMLFSLVIMVLVLSVVVVVFVRQTTMPLIHVAEGMKKVEAGIYDQLPLIQSDDEIELLVHGYNNMVSSIKEARDDVNQQNKRLSYLAYHDDLTGLLNRNGFKSKVNEYHKDEIENGYLIQMDIRGFKIINSSFGYDVGNGLLRRIGEYLLGNHQQSIKARTSGNEFSIWVTDMEEEQVKALINEIRDRINQTFIKDEVNQAIDLHIAYTKYPEHGEDFETLYKNASIAMKHAKDSRNHHPHCYNDAMEKAIHVERSMRNHLAKAMDAQEIFLVYQNQVNHKSGDIVGVEALARWNSPELGFVSPAIFIPAVHNLFLDIDFGNYIIRRVFRDYHQLVQIYGKKIQVSINISPAYFANPNFLRFTKEMLSLYEIPAESITYEITEDFFIDDFDGLVQVVRELRGLGIRIAIDDFGTGYSSMSYLGKIQVDEIKIDKAFVDELVTDTQAVKLFKSLCNVADAFGYQLVAEGVETEDQLSIIKGTSVEIVQGYLFSRPQALSDMDK